MTGTWEPANQLEQQLSDALRDGDQNAYFKLLSVAELVLPLPKVEPDPGQPAFTWPTSTHEGRTHVLAYTSVEAARACLGPGYEHFVRMPLAEMANTWPDSDWWLAVNSGLPIEGYLPAWFVGQLTANLPPAQEAPLAPETGPAAQPPAEQEAAHGTHAAPTGHDAVRHDSSAAPIGQELPQGSQAEQTPYGVRAEQETPYGAQADQEMTYGAGSEQESAHGPATPTGQYTGEAAPDHGSLSFPPVPETSLPPVPPTEPSALDPGVLPPPPGDASVSPADAHPPVSGPAPAPFGDARPPVPSEPSPTPLGDTHPPVPGEPSPTPLGDTHPPVPGEPSPTPLGNAHPPVPGEPSPTPLGNAHPPVPGEPAPAPLADTFPPVPGEPAPFGDAHPSAPGEPAPTPFGDAHPPVSGGPAPTSFGDVHSPVPGEPAPTPLEGARPPASGEPAPVTDTAPFPGLSFPTPPPEGPPPGSYPAPPAWEESFGETTIADAPTVEAFAREALARERSAGDRPTGEPIDGTPTAESAGDRPTWGAPEPAGERPAGNAPTAESAGGVPDGRTPAGEAPSYPSFSTAGAVPPPPAEGTPPVAETAPMPIVSDDEPMPPGPGQADVGPTSSPADAPTQSEPRPVSSDVPLAPHFTSDADFIPLDEEERLLYDAAARDDREGLLRTLLGASQIWVPMVEGGDLMLGPGRPGFQWYTRESGGRTVVPLFTGPSRMREAMGGHPFILSDLTKILRFWPDPAWDLVMNDGSAIGVTIPGDRITALSRRVDDEAAERLASDFPAQNDAERRLFEVRDDPDALLQVLLEASVFLPVWSRTPPTVNTPPSDPAFPWAAVSVRGRASMLAFTSFDWMKEAVGTTGFVMPTFADLLTAWQEPSWDVSVNPGTPIEIALSAEQINAIAASLANRAATPSAPLATPAAPPQTPLPEPAQDPAGIPVPAEAAPLTARPGPAQIPASISLPPTTTRPTAEPGPAQIPAGIPVPTTTAPSTAEPEPAQIPASISLPPTTTPPATEPGPAQIPPSISLPTVTAPPTAEPAPVPAGVPAPAETMPPIAAWLEPQAVDQAEPRTPADGAFTIMQKVLVHDQVPWYLDKAYDRIAGFVHRVQDVIDLNTPQRLYECLGLIRDGSPFTVDDPEVYVIRWAAYRAGLYRTPFGGTNEDALKEWGEDGWVVEPPPFTGDGFAPGSAGSIPEYKAESFRLPHSSEMYVISSDGTERFVARYDADRLVWEKDN
ncbi:SseB family protein [Actinoallomurus sp. NPDC050550]|uniref:SseB family protein n=1 Tax=Actinoallomurus sp. NPDC050550 TaxID=3154937 RepID=UPI0033F839BA